MLWWVRCVGIEEVFEQVHGVFKLFRAGVTTVMVIGRIKKPSSNSIEITRCCRGSDEFKDLNEDVLVLSPSLVDNRCPA